MKFYSLLYHWLEAELFYIILHYFTKQPKYSRRHICTNEIPMVTHISTDSRRQNN
jgi:hypothetical protein